MLKGVCLEESTSIGSHILVNGKEKCVGYNKASKMLKAISQLAIDRKLEQRIQKRHAIAI